MTTRWEKLGLILRVDGQHDWMMSHAANPTAVALSGSVYRVYFTSRDSQNRSHIGYFDLDLEKPTAPLSVSSVPALAPGPLGFFDDHGVYVSSLVRKDGLLYLYFTGWNPGPYPLYYTSAGIAVSRDGGATFERLRQAPILARSEFDPWMVSQPMVLEENGLWRMWYISGYKWEKIGDQLSSFYDIKYAHSSNGMDWVREGRVCLFHRPGEKNIARPCVFRDGPVYRMWYPSNSGDGYRIGYAESRDGLSWERKDDDWGMRCSSSGWDSEAVAYPWVVRHEDRFFMFYNGNQFGKDGVGLAIANASR